MPLGWHSWMHGYILPGSSIDANHVGVGSHNSSWVDVNGVPQMAWRIRPMTTIESWPAIGSNDAMVRSLSVY